MTAWEILSELLRFVGVSLLALITVSTVRIVLELIGPEGERLVREARERMDTKENTNDRSDHHREAERASGRP